MAVSSTYSTGPLTSQIHLLHRAPAFTQDPVEVVERKGLGHPDTLCDALACAISLDYARYTQAQCDGLILHHQFDKVMLVGGKTEVTFGEVGRFIEPVRVIVAGRASTEYQGRAVPVADIVEAAVRRYLPTQCLIPDLQRDVVIEQRWTTAAGPGTLTSSTGAIAEMFTPGGADKVRGYGAHYVANDTSYCVAYAPRSPLEQAVLEAEAWLNAPATKAHQRWLGTDIKLMAVRVEDEVHLTACLPQIARFVPDLETYQANLRQAADWVLAPFRKRFDPARLHLSLNTKDNYDEHNLYLTVTGASLSGDIGITGRGNRPNGLMTGNRPMSLEGASGKNPRYYSGIVYNLAAQAIARRLHAAAGAANVVEIVSQNGAPLQEPWQVIVTAEVEADQARALVREELARLPALTEQFVRGELSVY